MSESKKKAEKKLKRLNENVTKWIETNRMIFNQIQGRVHQHVEEMQSSSVSIKKYITNKSTMLSFGYLSKREIKMFIPSSIVMLCHTYFIGDTLNILDDDDNFEYFNEHCKNEILLMFFDILFPGKDDVKILLTLQKIIYLLFTALSDDDEGLAYKYLLYLLWKTSSELSKKILILKNYQKKK